MKTDFVQAGAVKLQYFEEGRGPETIVLVHGYRSSGRIWRLVQEALDPGRFRTIALSNRGAGDSDRTESESDYAVESFARDLHAAVQALRLSDFTLAGHSMGGATVAQFTLDHQDALKALVLLDPAPLAGRVLAEGWEEQLRESYRNGTLAAGSEASDTAPEDFRAALAADVARNPLERYVGGRRSMADLRLRDRLKELRIPTLVIGGDQDSTVGVDNILAEYLALPEATRRLHVFHGAGHSPNVEMPLGLAEVLERFVTVKVPKLVAAPAR